MNKPSNLMLIVAGVLSFWVLTQPVLADLYNGDFSENLDGWTVDEGVVDWSSPGVAKFSPDNDNEPIYSTLSQQFELNELALTLSFDFVMNVVGPPNGESDIFMALLLDEAESPVSPMDPAEEKWHFYEMEASDEGSFSGMYTLDVWDLRGQEVELIFSLKHDYGDFLETTVLLDKVSVSLVPAPGAVLLGSIGLSCVGWKLRKRQV